jgi:membrane protease subunit HflC
MTSLRISPVLLVFAALALIAVYNSFYIVEQTETALVTQFGNPVVVELKPGLKFKLPFIQTVEYFDNRLLEYVMPDEIEINASDEKRIRLEAFLRWRIIDPLAFARATRTAGIGGNRISTMNMQLGNLLGSSLRQVIGSVPMNALLSPQRDAIMRQIRELVAKQASSSGEPDAVDVDAKSDTPAKSKSGFGIEIIDVRIVKADLPPENSAAIFRRMQTERDREAKSYRAQGEEEAQRIRAVADRDRTVLLAGAQKKSEILRGEGDAEAAKIFADAFGQDPEFFEFYRTMQAYIRTLNAKDTTVVLSPDSQFLKEFSNPNKSNAPPAKH